MQPHSLPIFDKLLLHNEEPDPMEAASIQQAIGILTNRDLPSSNTARHPRKLPSEASDRLFRPSKVPLRAPRSYIHRYPALLQRPRRHGAAGQSNVGLQALEASRVHKSAVVEYNSHPPEHVYQGNRGVV